MRKPAIAVVIIAAAVVASIGVMNHFGHHCTFHR